MQDAKLASLIEHFGLDILRADVLRARAREIVRNGPFYAGLEWINGLSQNISASTAVTRAIGRLPKHLRWAAVCRAIDRGVVFIRSCDIDWGAVRMVRDAWRSDGPGAQRVRAAGMPSIEEAAEILGCDTDQVPAMLAPSFPRLPYRLARRIALGDSPLDLLRDYEMRPSVRMFSTRYVELTSREAHMWCLDGAPENIEAWYAGHYRLPHHRSLRVLRWMLTLRRCGRWHTLTKPRRMYRPDGERVVRLIDIIDEVDDVDIRTDSDSAARVMERVSLRLMRARRARALSDNRVLAQVPSWASTLPRWMRLLNTRADLAREGKEMSHCVGSYDEAVKRGDCHIISIRSTHGRSTVELSPDLIVRQHKGACNADPPRRHVVLLNAWLNRVSGACKRGEEQ